MEKNKLIEGGIYYLKMGELFNFEYCVVLKEQFDYVVLHCIEYYIDTEKAPVNKQAEIITCIEHGIYFKRYDIRFTHDSFNVAELSDIEVGGYLGQVNEDMLEKLSKLARPQYRMIFD